MNPSRLLILAEESEQIQELVNGLVLIGYECDVITGEEQIADGESADLFLIEAGDNPSPDSLRDMVRRIKQERHTSIILLAGSKTLRHLGNDADIDDFILQPYNLTELSVRIKRLLGKYSLNKESPDFLVAGDITIDLPRCEVTVKGKAIDLTFTEYELLKMLIRQKGHVLTREKLLNEIWGYDYFGGDRTVDVHITRLRNKIEDTSHTFIETVRNIGYRIRTDSDA